MELLCSVCIMTLSILCMNVRVSKGDVGCGFTALFQALDHLLCCPCAKELGDSESQRRASTSVSCDLPQGFY